jgi:tetratricopeptide (TPR) repeat protein
VFACLRGLTGTVWRSFLVAALFAVHPLHVESVAWISERKDVLSSFFGLAALWMYIQHVRRKEPGWMFLTGVMLLLSLLSKQMLVTFPFLLLVLDFWPLDRHAELPAGERWRFLAREKLPLFLLVLVFCGVAVWAQSAGKAVQTLDKFPLPIRLGNALLAYGTYLAQFFNPTRLAVFYPHSGFDLPWFRVAVAAAVLAGLSWLAWNQRTRRPYLLTGWLWFLGLMVPVLGLVQVGEQAHADRYMYLPLIGPCLALVWLAGEVPRASSLARGLGVAAVVLIAGLAVQARRQVATWQDSISLFGRAVQVSPQSGFCWNSLGLSYERQRDLPQAERCYREALQVDPRSITARCNLGALAQRLGQVDEARQLLDEALELEPRNSSANELRASLFVVEGAADRALEFYRRAIELNPYDASPRESLATVLRQLGKPEEALAQLKDWQKLDPDNPRLYNSLGTVMIDLEKPSEGEMLYLKALRLDSKYATARSNLGILKYRLGDYDAAVDQFRLANQLDPANTGIVENLSSALIEAGVKAAKEDRALDAKTLLEEAIALNPTNFFAHHRMGRIAVDKGFKDEARRHFEAALSPEIDRRKVQPGDLAMCHHDLGLMLAVQDNVDEAIPHFEAALELVPEFTPSAVALERARKIQGEMREAGATPVPTNAPPAPR